MTYPRKRALEEPVRQIANNAGYEGSVIVNQVKGFDAQAEKFVDMVKAGVIDPTKVVRTALQNAGSISGLMLTTEAPQRDPGGEQGRIGRARWRRHARHGRLLS